MSRRRPNGWGTARALGASLGMCALIVLGIGITSCARPVGANCGNAICDPGESAANCPDDCLCGNGACDVGESAATCPADCTGMGVCGDGACDVSETMISCPVDCTGLPNCGNGLCDAGETGANCPQDCVANCGNGVCDVGENATCPTDCAVCGNGVCETGEDTASCPFDCPAGPVCGDGTCDIGENSTTCIADCPVMGTDSGSGMPWVPPISDGVPCAPEACPVDAPNCVGPDDANAYCRADCNQLAVPDPCAPSYECVELSSGTGACLPAAPTHGCCNACGCMPADICVSVDMASPVCLVECNPASPVQCSPGETCVMLTGGTSTLGGACLPTVAPACSGNPVSEANCI